ncbi:Spermidine Putrescine ABC transporter permease component PotB [Marinobacterium lacunae]|uniref:Spermidine Putrescine ABC transporter permease component PotB n=1 Tax=Marinobacterium lacunae TaxID=1232683 RepID=A0A081G1Q3_9GAMM|nr:ABC transporter permease [Marinobacterium lacunae]KEA64708.1 Spermidine Putrescine ABC transporter permease component PotB [Marinobacterium lacunae]MBR9883920.1 ABC transporter permease [Oceanospirillales bacterium]
MSNPELTPDEIRQANRNRRRAKLLAIFFVLPLLGFIFVTFVAPIGTMLYRSFYHPTVSELVPETLAQLDKWSESSGELPPPDALNTFAVELKTLAKDRLSGKLAEEINRALPGSSSLIKSTARRVSRTDTAELQSRGNEILFDAHKKWQQVEVWRAIKKSGSVVTADFYLTALDLEHSPSGEIVQRGTQIYIDLYWKSLKIAFYITVLTAIIGFPLAWYLANAPTRVANTLMIFVLLPFWTSLLVRTTSWIALLQTNGVVNSTLMSLHIIDEPLEMLYTQFATVIAMTHILLPFMVLPLYSVMKGIDPSYFRAALSLGAKPIPAFVRIYMPMTVPGLSAGALLVFIISIGYYITPALVGGTEGQMISNIIAFHMQSSNNWELAAALGSLLLLLITLLYWLYDRLVGISNLKLG